MSDDELQHLMNAREALVTKRLTLAQIIAAPGDVPDNAIQGIVEVQRAIEVVDVAIEEPITSSKAGGLIGNRQRRF